MTTTRTRPPVPLTAARVLAGLQIAVGLLAIVAGGLAAVAGSGGDSAVDSEPDPWSGFLFAIAVAVAVAGLVTGVLLGIPLLVLRGGSPTRRVTGRGLLIGGEALLLLPLVVFLHVRFGSVFALGTDPFSLVSDLLLVVPLVVIGLLLVPSVGRWAVAP